MQFNFLTILAAATTTASAAALSGCNQGTCPDHNAAVDFISGAGFNVVSARIRDNDGCRVVGLSNEHCAYFTYYGRPVQACFGKDDSLGQFAFTDGKNERFCYNLAHEFQSGCNTDIWTMKEWVPCV